MIVCGQCGNTKVEARMHRFLHEHTWVKWGGVIYALARSSNSAALDHAFLPVNGHPDDDECTNREDGTDAAYCGLPRAAHAPEGSIREDADA